MRIKKHANKNQYLLTEAGVWVRDFTQEHATSVDINRLTAPEDFPLLLENEHQNHRMGLPQVDTEGFRHRGVVIVSDGYDFKRRHRLLASIPSDVAVIAVNGALASWQLVGDDCPSEEKRVIDYYVVNNPYQECLKYVPRRNRYYPRCIASARTNPKFTSHYRQRGTIYRYQPTPDAAFCAPNNDALYTIDDYRNPICAALGLAYRFDADDILLACCDDSFEGQRPGSVPVGNGLYAYPTQRQCHSVIDGYLYWMTHMEDREVRVGDFSSGWKYQNAEYISDDGLADFFKG